MQPTMFPPAEGTATATGMQQSGKRSQQTIAAATVFTTNSGRLFITDRLTKQQYLVYTGSDLFPTT